MNVLPNCNNKADILRQLGLSDNGRNYKLLNSIIKQHSLDLSKFFKSYTIEKICPVCGKVFEIKTYERDKTTCSYSCSNTYFRSGKNNPNYKDVSEYKDKQNKQLSKKYRKLCFEHHPHKCVVCGEDRIVDVHHYDENRLNNKIFNFIPLCPTHHRYYHSKYKKEVEEQIEKYHNEFLAKMD